MKNVVSSALNQAPLVPLLIGQGKLARHLHQYFHLINYQHKHFDDAHDLNNPDLYRKIREVNTIWILTNDQSIEPVLSSIKKEMFKQDINPDQYTFIHSSAATEIKDTETIHPLMTFGENLYNLEQYQNIPFALISDQAEVLSARFPISNTRFNISSHDRSLYHAYAVLMSNLPILLWSLTTHEAKLKLGLQPEIFDPILKQTLENFLKDRGSALTGPIARKDDATIVKNLTALGHSPLSEIYQAFLIASNEGAKQ